MMDKQSMVVGVLIGLVFGLIGVLVTFYFTTEGMKTKQAEAYDLGLAEGLKRSGTDGINISSHMLQENQDLHAQLDGLSTQLQALQSRDDLTPQAKEQIAGILESLK
ncbi:MAG: hypothetical protein KDB32_06145 [Planctomycetes bacterium]|nr:hypothetical protein [Planctomycetota bacterium]